MCASSDAMVLEDWSCVLAVMQYGDGGLELCASSDAMVLEDWSCVLAVMR